MAFWADIAQTAFTVATRAGQAEFHRARHLGHIAGSVAFGADGGTAAGGPGATAIVAELLPNEWVAFSALQKRADTTNGNLGAHLGKLLTAGYVEERKSFVNRKPQTRYRLTQRGRHAFRDHVRYMQSLIEGETFA